MGWESLAGSVGGAVLGGLIGGAGTPSSQNSNTQSTSSVNLRNFDDISKGQSGLESAAYQQQLSGFADLQKLIGQGPGANEVGANTQFQNQYANQLQGLLSNIANPNQQANFATAQQYFAPQQTALNQQFQQQGIESDRLAARLGRAGNDPILRNKLAQEQTRQQTMLNSQIGSFGQQLPQFQAEQIMGVGNALSNLRGGLATQAMNNRSTLLGMGQQLGAAERQYRLQTAERTGSQSTQTSGSQGGGVGQMLAGALGGGAQFGGAISGLLGSMGGGGGGSGGSITAGQAGGGRSVAV